MIERQAGKIRIECDSCREVFEGADRALWQEVWHRASRAGWRSSGAGLYGCAKCGRPK